MSRQEAIEMINQLSDEQLQKVVDYIKEMCSQKAKVYEKF